MMTHLFKLDLDGNNPKSVKDLKSIKKVLDLEFDNNYTLEVIDVIQKPQLAEEQNIVFTPTLIKIQPLPKQKFIGDFSIEPEALNYLNGFKD
ncbi:circadian clock KaiB family protein [Gloeothece verrucosa]|uniref:KaiB domain protein n=1 Tax=Gloeothece verrucosa (strain PCC 7822) TaxID=497965 RepID=E0U976_GLOV7|nr:circadian clock KaiB family protein [Gloeothece verrucosa]ADN17334.1 KaiB domain protein [Gloeothece verrucosa PCC 7822]